MKQLIVLTKEITTMKTTLLILTLVATFNALASNSLGKVLDFQSCDTYLNALNVSHEEVNEPNTEITFYMERDSLIKCDYNSFQVKEVTISRADYYSFVDAFSSSDIPLPKHWLKRYNLLRTLRGQFINYQELPSGDVLVDSESFAQTFIFDGQDFIGVSFIYHQALREGMLELSKIIKKNLKGFKTEKNYTSEYNFELLGTQIRNGGCRLEVNIKTEAPLIFRSAEEHAQYPGAAQKIIIDFKEGISWKKPMDDQRIKTEGYATTVITDKGNQIDLKYLDLHQGARKVRSLFQRLHQFCY